MPAALWVSGYRAIIPQIKQSGWSGEHNLVIGVFYCASGIG